MTIAPSHMPSPSLTRFYNIKLVIPTIFDNVKRSMPTIFDNIKRSIPTIFDNINQACQYDSNAV